jgi:hypothetical protein
MGGVAAVDSRGTRRLLIALLAVALVAAGLLATAPSAQADNGGNGLDDCEEFIDYDIESFDNGNGENGAIECDIDNEGQAWTAVFSCDDCALNDLEVHGVGETDNLADIEVNATGGKYTIVLTTNMKGNSYSPPPGRAFVFIGDDNIEDDDERLAKCTGKAKGSAKPNCVSIRRVSGAFTQYTVMYNQDPRFRFR